MFRKFVPVVSIMSAVVALLSIPASGSGEVAQPPLSMELVTESGLSPEGQQQWMEALKKLGITNLRIRSERPGDEPTIVNRGTDDNPRYAVLGVLAKDNRLVLPGLTVRFGQRQQLSDWFARLRSGGVDAVTGDAGAFGLTAKQFVALHEAVKPAIQFETKGKPVRTVVQQIGRQPAGRGGNRCGGEPL